MATKKAVKATSAVSTIETPEHITEVTMLPIELLIGDRNTRFSLIKSRVEAMADSIIDNGGVMEPMEAYALSDEDKADLPGKEFRIVFGHYRLAGLELANSRGYTFEAPVIIREATTDLERTKRQIAENLERENPTPIDKAVAMQTLLDLYIADGKDMNEAKRLVREAFPAFGGRKGTKAQPASNSHVNMTLSFLKLPKKIQNLIQNNEIGVGDAYYLTTLADDDKRNAAVEAAMAARLKEIATEEEAENKYLEGEAKRAEADKKVLEFQTKLEQSKAAYDKSIEDAKEKSEAANKAYQAKLALVADKEKSATAAEAHKAAEKASIDATKAIDKARNEYQKLQERADKLASEADARAKKLADAKAASKAAAPAKPLNVKGTAEKSAAVSDKEKPNVGGIPITLGAVKKVVDDLALPGSYPKVSEVGKLLKKLLGGHLLSKDLVEGLAALTGESSEKKKK